MTTILPTLRTGLLIILRVYLICEYSRVFLETFLFVSTRECFLKLYLIYMYSRVFLETVPYL